MSATFKFQKIAQNIFKQNVKSFTLQDIIKHKNIKVKNLYEMLSRYPGGGLHFKVSRKSWPEDMYYEIKGTDYKGSRSGKLFGLLYKKNKVFKLGSHKIHGGSKRGIWRYQVMDNEQVTLDNGMVYTREQLLKMYQITQKQDSQNENNETEAVPEGEQESENNQNEQGNQQSNQKKQQ